jgi:UDP-N-acetylmuramoyl-L-alanyl-D-glutamate--2,6-diaminopimelate ligase
VPLLTELWRSVSEPVVLPEGAQGLNITGISLDSSRTKPGDLFVGLQGTKLDGSQFIPNAEKNGAVLALCSSLSDYNSTNIPVIRLANPRLALAQLAAAFYGTQPAHMVAVTGTDGKTSTADFFRQLMHLAGKYSASLGTVGVLDGEGKSLYPGTLTTPDPLALHRILAELVASGVSHAVMEASSHGLDQYRLDGVKLQAAAFTNIARDHLDYHLTEEAYFAAKARLFTELLPVGGTAVVNQDDGKYPALQAVCKSRGLSIVGFGQNGTELRISRIIANTEGQLVSLEAFGQHYEIDVPFVGAFQVMNILAALGLAHGAGEDIHTLIGYIPRLRGVPGRLQHVVTLRSGAGVYIDYAHTPMALANILRTLRPHTERGLHVVFGCGGDRDSGKRPLMGKAACELADYVIVTDDNPRTEDPALIRAAIMAQANERAKEVADRRVAIYRALESLQQGDILVIAGKGHETTQIIGDKQLPFDDAQVAREAASELGLLA